MNEAQAVTGHWAERRAWIKEMSDYLKSLDPNHVVTPGDWGYRTAEERREWLADHLLANVDYCDVHNYPRPDENSFVDSPRAMREFIDNRAAAAFFVNKPLVFGEFGMGAEGFNGFSRVEWFRAFLESNVRAGSAGAMFWILTPDPGRGYSVTYTSQRDESVMAEVSRAARMFALLESADPPERLTDDRHHLVPRQFAWMRSPGDPATIPQLLPQPDRTILYRFKPEMAASARFEKLGSAPGYIWGFGVGNLDYVVPAREERRRVSAIVVRAHIQPVPPVDARPQDIKTTVTLFVNGTNFGSRLVSAQTRGQTFVQEWRVDSFRVRFRAMRGLPLTIRFAVTPEADWPYGVNISNWPAGYDSHDANPVEVEVRH